VCRNEFIVIEDWNRGLKFGWSLRFRFRLDSHLVRRRRNRHSGVYLEIKQVFIQAIVIPFGVISITAILQIWILCLTR
jgi:hypothetical protein